MDLTEFIVSHGWHFITMLILLVGSHFFSGTETALFNLTRGQLYKFAHGGSSGQLVARMMASPRAVLNTILLANLLVNTAYLGIATLMVHEVSSLHAPWWASLAMSLAPLLTLILLAEICPKMIASVIGEKWSLVAAPIFVVVQRVLAPAVWLMQITAVQPFVRMLAPPEKTSREISANELAEVLDLSARRGLLDQDTNMLLQSIIDISAVRVSEVMVPRVDIISFEVNDDLRKLVELFRMTKLRRIPVYEGTIDNTLGVIHSRKLMMNPNAPLRELIAKIPYVPQTAPLEKVLLQLRVTKSHMAFVVDEYGGTAGLATLKDIVEHIVGDMPEIGESVIRQPVQKISDREYLLDGNLAMHEWIEAFGINLSKQKISTVGGFVMSMLGHLPKVGDQVQHSNIVFTIDAMQGRRISRIRLTMKEAQQ